jgi:hypothetical protein
MKYNNRAEAKTSAYFVPIQKSAIFENDMFLYELQKSAIFENA